MSAPLGWTLHASERLAIVMLRRGNEKMPGSRVRQVWYLDPTLGGIPRRRAHAGCERCPAGRGGWCYVNQIGAHAVIKSYRSGRYPCIAPSDPEPYHGASLVRIGAAGEPLASDAARSVTRSVLDRCKAGAVPWTCYTSRWAEGTAQAFRGEAVASCHSPTMAHRAQERGWATFQVTLPGDPVVGPAVRCAGGCLGCPTPCNGSVSVWNPAHGPSNVLGALIRWRKNSKN